MWLLLELHSAAVTMYSHNTTSGMSSYRFRYWLVFVAACSFLFGATPSSGADDLLSLGLTDTTAQQSDLADAPLSHRQPASALIEAESDDEEDEEDDRHFGAVISLVSFTNSLAPQNGQLLRIVPTSADAGHVRIHGARAPPLA